jgi:pimeloyl-ACP methyl ester carboxylesterase
VRAAIGATKINLMGVSYGTALPSSTRRATRPTPRTVTIDGIVPNTLVLGNEHARNLEVRSTASSALRGRQGLRRQARQSARTARMLMASCAQDPPLVAYRDAHHRRGQAGEADARHIASLARMFAYAPQVAGLLPLELNEAAQGRYEPLMALSKLLSSTSAPDHARHAAVGDLHRGRGRDEESTTAEGQPARRGPDHDMRAQCAAWPQGVRPDGFRQPLTGNVPVLILSGEFDPVTPPRYGEQVPKNLPNSRHLVVRGQGHNVIARSAACPSCSPLRGRGRCQTLDVSCLDKVPYAQPFTGFYWWEP